MPDRQPVLRGFMSQRRRRRRLPIMLAAAAAACAVIGVVAFLILNAQGGDVHKGEEVEFRPPERPATPARKTVDWPFFHRDVAHSGYLAAKLSPPYRRVWLFSGKVLMEFPPIVAGRTLFFTRNNGGTYAVDSSTGKVKWKKRIGLESASSPAYSGGRLYVSSLTRDAGGNGKVVCLRARNGRVLWQLPLSSRTESSVIVRKGVAYFGSESGTLYAVWARTGKVKWTFKAGGSLKASPALSGSTLYVGDYSGRMYAVWARTGRQRWSTGTSGRTFGLAAGNFYSTPAAQFGRVYAGNTDGKVYSFSARTGELAWSKSTGGYVYSSPAVANVEGAGAMVYVGSYDGNLYGLDARTGATRWTARAGGRISGGPSVIGRTVYVANLDSKSTIGVGAATGTRVFSFPRGAYNAVVSDGRRLYLTGYASVTALAPKRRRASGDR